MRATIRPLLSVSLAASLILPAVSQTSPAQSTTQTKTTASGPLLEDGTPIKLRIGRTVSSADAHVGDTVDFEVLEEVKVGNLLVVPKGGTAWATVTEAESKKRMARGGKLGVNIDSVRLVDGEKVALRAVKEVKGGGHTGAMTGGIVATAIVFFPAAPFFLFMHGKDITIPKGTEITAYINGNFPIELAKFQNGAQSVQASAPTSAVPNSTGATLDISSTPANADIELDGNFAGNTPSSIGVSPGEHTIRITKAGFGTWERKIKSSSGNVRIAAELTAPAAPSTVPPATPATTPTAAPTTAPAQTSTVVTSANPAPDTSATPASQIKPAVMRERVAEPNPGQASSVSADTEGTASITSDPDGADIFVDSVGHGHTPALVKLKPGKHHVQLAASGYPDWIGDIEVKSGSIVNVSGKLEK